MLTEEMQTIIRNYTGGSVASVNDDGTAAVSPKATLSLLMILRLLIEIFALQQPVVTFRLDRRSRWCFSMS